MKKYAQKVDVLEGNVTHILSTPVPVAHILPILEMGENILDNRLLLLELLHLERLTTTGSLLLKTLKVLVDELHILDAQLLRDDLEITDGVDVTLDVDDLGVVEATDDLEDGVDGADVRQEGIAETGTGGGTAGQTSDIIDRQVGGNLRFGLLVVILLSIIHEGVDGSDGVGERGKEEKVEDRIVRDD